MKHITFWYNEKWSEYFKAYIIHDNNLRFFNLPSFSNEFVSPMFGNSNILLGINKESRIFELEILLEGITLARYNKFLQWLDFDGKGHSFAFDFFGKDAKNKPQRFFDRVKLESLSEGELNVVFPEDCSSSETYYNITLNISFATVGDWAVREVKNESFLAGSNSIDIENEKELPTFFEIKWTDNIILYMKKERTPGTIEWDGGSESNHIFMNFVGSGNFTYDSSLGVVYKNTGEEEKKELVFLGEKESKVLFLEPGFKMKLGFNRDIEIKIIKRSYF